ncbi:uncharacterized protein LOC110451381 isoform X2 [Mizuhopecten yessoensis]|uniref:uncharacterized protein LOC110451381 isoform X2 n=1 Tax=Mizuhopecten yessoensis TaxID=6573 RepID=UPI000B45A606|nr:uncharacterized protein LOC110451381 isoform X2 [Mizuhopecten yessoensis]
MSVLSYVRSNLFTLGLLLLIAGFSTPSWQGYTVHSSDNDTYTGHHGLWHKYLSNDSVSCKGDFGSDTEDSGFRDDLHKVRDFLAMSIAFSVILLAIHLCCLHLCLSEEDINDDDEGCAKCALLGVQSPTVCAMFIVRLAVTLTIFGLVLSAILIYEQKIYSGTRNIQEETQYKSGSFIVIVVSIVMFGLSTLVCGKELLDLKKTFILPILFGLIYFTRKLFDAVEEDRRRYIILWSLHLVVLTLFSVGLFSCSWFTVTSTGDNNVTVTMGMWFQCREQYTLMCCSSINNFYTETPGWFFTCRDITMVAYVLYLLAVIFSSTLVFVPTFRVPLLITHICSGVTLVVSCVHYGMNVTKEVDGHSRFGSAFIISVVVSASFIFFIIEFPISTACLQDPSHSSITEPLLGRSYRNEEDYMTSGDTWREKFFSWKERLTLFLIHRRSRMGAQIPVNEETDETEDDYMPSGDTWREKLFSWKERLTLFLKHRRSRMGAQIPVNEETDETVCKICMENPVDTKLIPCGHTCCKTCVHSLQSCHVCRRSVETTYLVIQG